MGKTLKESKKQKKKKKKIIIQQKIMKNSCYEH